MCNKYIPVATDATKYYKPQSEQEVKSLFAILKVGDMVFKHWVFSGMWYTVGLLDKTDQESICLFPNIIMKEVLPTLTRWGMERMTYLKENRKFLAAQFGTIGLHKHCLEIEKQAEQRKHSMMTAIRKDPANRVTEQDKAQNPIAWVGRMNNFQAMVHDTIYADLIYA